MLSPAREQQQQQPGGSNVLLDSSNAHAAGEAEFGVPALRGYTFSWDGSLGDALQGSNLVQSLGSRAMSSFPEFIVNGSGTPGIDGSHGVHGVPGRTGAKGTHGKDGYGPGRPGKFGKPGKDGKPGTAGKKGKKGTNGTNGGRALNVCLSLSGEGLDSLTVSGHVERVTKQTEVQSHPSDSPLPNETKVAPTALDSLTVSGHEQRVVKQTQGQKEGSDDSPLPEETKLAASGGPVLLKEPLEIVHRLNTYANQRSLLEVDDTDNLMRESSVLIKADGPHGAALNFFSQNGVLLVCAHGGRGGNGGNGGNGGYGGDGGDGGHGGKGGDGKKGLKPGFSGENGGRGGDGGAGMAGGEGGDGSPAGKGGNAGAGGRVTIQTRNARLLMLVETDARVGAQGKAGKPGLGGEGGKAGRGGSGGPGGRGGPPWDKLYLKRHHTYKYYYGCKPGISGVGGRFGGLIGPQQSRWGSPGAVASDGKEAKEGQVTWILKSAEGEIVEKAKDRFNCAVCQFRVRAGSSNGIISPGGTITIDKVRVWNNGGMTLPAGTMLSFAATGVLTTSSKNMKKVEILPELRKNKRYKCVSTFSMAVEKLDGPAGGSPFQAMVSVAPSIELCGRKFSITGQVLEVPVQYPVQIVGDVRFPHTVHQGSTVTVNLNLRNISARSFGQSKKSLGRVEAVVLFFLELELGQRVEQRWRKEVPEIGAGQDQQLEFDCRVDANGQPYSILSVQIHLLLKGQSVEYRHLESRIIPVYGGTDVDAVLVTDTDFKPGVYNIWKSILALLGLKCVFWDISWYQTYSMEDVPWLGKHRLVIFTHSLDDASLAHWLRIVLPQHVTALGGPYGIENAGAIFVGATTKEIGTEIVDWSNGEKLQDVEITTCFTSCWGDPSNTDGMKRPVVKAAQVQKNLRTRDSSFQDYTIHVAPLRKPGAQAIPLLLVRETLPAMFRTRAISVQMIEDPSVVELLASSPLLTAQEAPIDIYSGISTAIGGLITTQQNDISPSFRLPRADLPQRPITLDGRYITLGLTLAGMIVALPIQFRIDILFRFARHPSTALPVLSSSGIALTEIIAISLYNDLKSDWLTQRDFFPHGHALVAEFHTAAATRGFMSVIDMESFVVSLTGGLVLLKDEMNGFSRRKARAKHTIKGMLTQMRLALGETNYFYVPKAEKVRMDYQILQQTLPPWLFSYVDELQVIRVVEDYGLRLKK